MSAGAGWAGLAAACAVVLLLTPRGRLRNDAGIAAAGRVRALVPVLVAAVAATALTQLLEGSRLAAGAIGVVVALGLHRLARQARRSRAAGRVAALVLGVCEGMAADLVAGQTPAAALRRAATEWPPLAAAARAAELGGDVPLALRELAGRPGAEAMRTIAAAWQVSHRSGSGLAGALSQAVGALRERRRTSQMVASELASARATAHLMAVLPVGVLLLGSGIGGDPVGFLLDTPAGLACLGLGSALALTGLFWLQRISEGVLAG